MKQARIAVLVLTSTAAMLAFCTPSIASACEEAVRIVQPSPAQTVASAEKVIEVSPNEAARVILSNVPGVRSPATAEDPLRTRARRVLAIALVRTSGGADKAFTSAQNLDGAVQTLRAIEQKRKNDPAVQADLGEALAKTASGKAEALAIRAQAAIDRCKQMSGSRTAAASTCKVVVAKA